MSEFTRELTVRTTFPDPAVDSDGRFGLLGSDKVVIGLYNNLNGSVTLNGFKVAFFPNSASEAIDGPTLANEWLNPDSGSVIQHGNPVDPTTLAAGSKMYFILDRLQPMHSLQVLATVASGEGKLKIEFNRNQEPCL